MNTSVRYGLIVGAVSLFLTACVSFAIGLCGPVVPLIAGAVAGYLTVRKEMPSSQNAGGKSGAIAGAITGAISVVGQVAAGVFSLAVLPKIAPQFTQFVPPGSESNPVYWLSGFATSACIGLFGVALGAAAGFAAGYFGTSNPSTPPPAAPFI